MIKSSLVMPKLQPDSTCHGHTCLLLGWVTWPWLCLAFHLVLPFSDTCLPWLSEHLHFLCMADAQDSQTHLKLSPPGAETSIVCLCPCVCCCHRAQGMTDQEYTGTSEIFIIYILTMEKDMTTVS